MPGSTEDDLLGRDGGVGDEVVVGGDDLVDVDEVFGLCWLSCACMHGHSVSRATGRISPFRCAKHSQAWCSPDKDGDRKEKRAMN